VNSITPTAVDFGANGATDGSFTVAPGSDLVTIGTAATVKDLNFVTLPLNQSFLLSSFVSFQANPSLKIDLTFINLGASPPSGCTANPPAFGQTCTPIVPALVSPANPLGLSPYNFTNLTNASTLQFVVDGILVNGAVSTPVHGVFTAQFTTSFQTILAGMAAGTSPTITSFSATFVTTTTPASVPEPTTMLLLGTGVVGIAAKVKKRKKQSTD